MKHVVIESLGPIKHADVELSKNNIVVGSQGSGKSCLLKTVSYCTWLEKRIQLSQTPKVYLNNQRFIHDLVTYHKMPDFVTEDTYIKYESDTMVFSFNNRTGRFYFRWKDRWGYRCPKVSYIPSERNLIAVVPNWFDVKFDNNNIRGFMSEWEESRKTVKDAGILNLNVQYHYNESHNRDSVLLSTGRELELTNASSGLQSLIPICVHLEWLFKRRLAVPRKQSVANQRLGEAITQEIYRAMGGERSVKKPVCTAMVGNAIFAFESRKDMAEFQRVCDAYLQQRGCELFLEEPELNLFPPTQVTLMEWLMDCVAQEPNNQIFLATHSPYVVTSFLEKERENLSLFLINQDDDGGSKIRNATDKEMEEMYDYGVDVFFNIESFR